MAANIWTRRFERAIYSFMAVSTGTSLAMSYFSSFVDGGVIRFPGPLAKLMLGVVSILDGLLIDDVKEGRLATRSNQSMPIIFRGTVGLVQKGTLIPSYGIWTMALNLNKLNKFI